MNPFRWASLRNFLYFATLSGMGWFLDFGTFLILVGAAHLPESVANFFSSYVGLTFVWITSLQRVFNVNAKSRHHFLLVYWVGQFFSILAYSWALHIVAQALSQGQDLPFIGGHADASAKIIITPFNLVSNYIFMKVLTQYMHRAKSSHA